MCAFISSDLAPGERVYMKGPAGYNIGEGNCMYMLKCIYGHVQASRQYYMLCREVYQEAGLKQLPTDECVFIRYVYNIIGQPSLTNENLLVNDKFLNMEIVPMPMSVYKSCCHPVAAMILVMYVCVYRCRRVTICGYRCRRSMATDAEVLWLQMQKRKG